MEKKERKPTTTPAHVRKDFSLVVRLWEVKTHTGEITWRGSIDRVPNGDPIYFQTLEALFEKVKVILSDDQDNS